jgi:hypothetical protein
MADSLNIRKTNIFADGVVFMCVTSLQAGLPDVYSARINHPIHTLSHYHTGEDGVAPDIVRPLLISK